MAKIGNVPIRKLTIFLIISSILEVLGVSLVLPLIALLLDSSNSLPTISYVNNFDIKMEKIVFIVISVYLIKSVVQIYISKEIAYISLAAQVNWSKKILEQRMLNKSRKLANSADENEVFEIHSVSGAAAQGGLLNFIKICVDISSLSVICLFLLYVHPFELGLIMSFCFVFGFIYYKVVAPKSGKFGEQANIFSQSNLGIIKDSLSHRREISLLKTNANFLHHFGKNGLEMAQKASKSIMFSAMPRSTLDTLAILMIALVPLTQLVWSLELSTNEILPVLGIVLVRIVPMVALVLSAQNTLKFSENSVDRIFNALKDSKNNTPSLEQDILEPSITNYDQIIITEQRVMFPNKQTIRYPRVNLFRGQISVMIGESGIGKSLFFEMILGLIKGKSSKIVFKNKKIIIGELSKLTKDCLYIPQYSKMIEGDFFQNVYLKYDVSFQEQEKVRKILNECNLFAFARKHQDLHDKTFVKTLSGGELQRLAILRCFVLNKKIILMDEPTSALDHDNIKLFFRALKKYCSGRFVLIIAHDQYSIKFSDNLIDLQKTNK